MGVAKVWRYSCELLANTQKQHFLFSRWSPSSSRRPISCTAVCGFMLFALGLISLFTGYVASNLELYSHRLTKGAWFYKQDGDAPIDIWKSRYSTSYYGCSERGPHFASAVNVRSSNGYLLIATSGGLNQQRTGITDAVVVARILNATLVVPELDHHSFWKDDSDFVNIFDVKWFISYLAKDVTVVKRVPEKVMRLMGKPPYTMRVPRKSEPEYYLDQVLPVLLRRRVSKRKAEQLILFFYHICAIIYTPILAGIFYPKPHICQKTISELLRECDPSSGSLIQLTV